ncbi:MAG TPA: hypothetical protein VMU47_17815 [Caldimonas sp.]|nr:hypothetical protein [Caldimonas sp.]
MAWSLALGVAALGAIGLATSLFSGRGPAYSAARQVIIGAAAAGVTCGIGALIGVSPGPDEAPLASHKCDASHAIV